MRLRWIYIALITAIMLSACTNQADRSSQINIRDAWARPATGMNSDSASMDHNNMSGSVSAAYMLIKNTGETADRLLGASSDACQAVELHTSVTKDGVTSMLPVDYVDVPANGEAELKPGSYHIMLIGLKADLKPGDKIKLRLEFKNASPIDLEVEVREP